MSDASERTEHTLKTPRNYHLRRGREHSEHDHQHALNNGGCWYFRGSEEEQTREAYLLDVQTDNWTDNL
jgi:hypothetical protein